MSKHPKIARLVTGAFLLTLFSLNGWSEDRPLTSQQPVASSQEKWVLETVKIGMAKEDVIRKMGPPLIEDDHPKIEGQSSEGKAIMYYFAPPPKAHTQIGRAHV